MSSPQPPFLAPAAPSGRADPLLVACLCAAWCNTCTDYQSVFAQLQQEFADARWVWIDIEDQADLVDPLEVDNFPTLLIAAQGKTKFFGPVLPHLESARRLIQTQGSVDAATSVPADQQAEVNALVARLQARP